MKIAIFSDLHLKQDQITLRRKFSKLLVELLEEQQITDLWLLGDIFDLLIGPYPFWFEHYKDVFRSLELLKKNGVKILWIEGNHDFHITRLLNEYGIDVSDGELTYLINDSQKKVFLAHGDLANPADIFYLKWREITRSSLLRKTLDWVPNFVAKKYLLPFATRQSARSRKHSSHEESPALKELYQSFARKKFADGFDAVIMGHCHIEDFFSDNGRFYLNLGSALDGTLRYALWDLGKDPFPKVLKYPKIEA